MVGQKQKLVVTISKGYGNFNQNFNNSNKSSSLLCLGSVQSRSGCQELTRKYRNWLST